MNVSCIIPAYNEEKTIASIIYTVKRVNEVNEIIVVSDGSTDTTAIVAKQAGAKVIELQENMGKGAAVKIGIENAKNDIVMLLDADLIGLNEQHVLDLLLPVLNDEADMTVGIFVNGRLTTDLAQKIAPFLSGQRVLKKHIFCNIDNIEFTKYGLEVALTRYLRKNNFRVKNVELPDLTHIMKEEKLGFKEGFKARMKMYRDIIKTFKM